MARVALVTVPDDGAAWMVRDALAEAGIAAEIERAVADHPYAASALARPMRIWVPDVQLEQAQEILASLENELANHDEEIAAQALAAGHTTSDEAAPPHGAQMDRLPRLSWALALAVLIPFPVVCFYGHARRTGALFVGVFLAGLVCAAPLWMGADVDEVDEPSPIGGSAALLFVPAAKLADVAVGLPMVLLRRRRALAAQREERGGLPA